MRIEVSGDGSLVEHLLCSYDNTFHVFHLDIKLTRRKATIQPLDAVRFEGLDIYDGKTSYRPLKVSFTSKNGELREAEIRLFPNTRSFNEEVLVGDDQVFAHYEERGLHHFRVVSKDTGAGQSMLASWPKENHWWYKV